MGRMRGVPRGLPEGVLSYQRNRQEVPHRVDSCGQEVIRAQFWERNGCIILKYLLEPVNRCGDTCTGTSPSASLRMPVRVSRHGVQPCLTLICPCQAVWWPSQDNFCAAVWH